MKEKKVFFVWRQLYEMIYSLNDDRSITKIDNGLGACGELHYPSYHAKYGWELVLCYVKSQMGQTFEAENKIALKETGQTRQKSLIGWSDHEINQTDQVGMIMSFQHWTPSSSPLDCNL
ncbi:putative beta-amylase [Helianthus annuus]|nr:putative beta-amylase [Helianthus annuus]